MTDLRARFREVDRTQAPDLWPDIVNREPGPRPSRELWQRAGVAAAAILVAALAFTYLARAFLRATSPGDGPTPSPSAAVRPEAKSNGVIAFVRTDPDSTIPHESPFPLTDLYTVEPDGSGARRIAGEQGFLFRTIVAWSPDGSRIAIPGNRGIEVLEADGSNATRITDCRSPSCDFDYLPSWSPDGREVAFSRLGVESSLWVVGADGSDPRLLTDRIHTINAVVWSPDGGEIAVLGYVGPTPEAAPLSIHFVDPGTGELLREVTSPEGLDFLTTLTWSPDGQRFAFDAYQASASEGEGIYVMRTDGSDVRLLTACPPDSPRMCADQNPAWSPDGKLIAFTRALPERGSDGFMGDIFVIDPNGGEPRRVTGGPGLDCCPAWQPLPVP